MTSPNDASAVQFAVNHGESRVISFCCDVALYTNQDLSAVPEAVLHVYERFLAAVPRGVLRWHATENMTRHKPVTPRVFEMLPGWLKPGAAVRKYINIHLTDAEHFDEAGNYTFWVCGEEARSETYGAYANAIRCTFPGQWAIDSPDALLAFVADASARFPFQSGHAGFVLEVSRYYRGVSDVIAWRLSMQHPGLDISNPLDDRLSVGRDGVKGVNWLTMLGGEFVERLGGVEPIRAALPESVSVFRVGDGVILRAGSSPRWGHTNRNDVLPDYRAVYRLVAPLQREVVERYGAFDLPGGDHREKTKAWLRRFADGH